MSVYMELLMELLVIGLVVLDMLCFIMAICCFFNLTKWYQVVMMTAVFSFVWACYIDIVVFNAEGNSSFLIVLFHLCFLAAQLLLAAVDKRTGPIGKSPSSKFDWKPDAACAIIEIVALVLNLPLMVWFVSAWLEAGMFKLDTVYDPNNYVLLLPVAVLLAALIKFCLTFLGKPQQKKE